MVMEIIRYVWFTFTHLLLYAFVLLLVLSILNSFDPINNFFLKLFSHKWTIGLIILILLTPFIWLEVIDWGGLRDEKESGDNIYFSNCTDAHNRGYYNITPDKPGYRSALDRDGDGYACEE
jgi:hypothetical protein